MKVQLLPSSVESDGSASMRQHLSCIIVDDLVAVDAGSLAMSCSAKQREQVRNIVLSHVHLDHIAGLPIFLDDLFATLTEPVRVHATKEMIDVLERDIFNWAIYPKFSELANQKGNVLEYETYEHCKPFSIGHLTIEPVVVNHSVQSCGLILSDNTSTVGISGDTAATDDIWAKLRTRQDLKAVLVECAFPNEMSELALASCHLTPNGLEAELKKLGRPDVPVYVVHIKPMYRDAVIRQLGALGMDNLSVFEIGRVYDL